MRGSPPGLLISIPMKAFDTGVYIDHTGYEWDCKYDYVVNEQYYNVEYFWLQEGITYDCYAN